MIVGLVAITPCAGYVSGSGAIWVGLIASTIVWFAWTYVMPVTMKKVDDAMGVVYTHGVAGLCGGLLVGIFADPAIIVYTSSNGNPIAVKGWLYGNRHQFFIQLFAALTIIVYDALMTFIILRVIRLFTPLRMPDDELESRRHGRPRRAGLPGRRGLHPGRVRWWAAHRSRPRRPTGHTSNVRGR